MSSEILSPLEPKFNESALIEQRLRALTVEASRGEHSRYPIYFFGTVEQEQGMVDGAFAQALAADPYGKMAQEVSEGDPVLIPETYRPLTSEERNTALEEFRRDARAEIEALIPKNDVERGRKERWLQAVPSFDVLDLVNFRFYQEFSEPTLGHSTPRTEVTFSELAAAEAKNSKSGNWIEYRFGKDSRQSGWYDAPGVSEYRLNPCPPREADQRNKVMKQRLYEIGGQYGCVFIGDNVQLNLSAYQQDQPPAPRVQLEKAADGSLAKAKVAIAPLRPLLGSVDGREETTINALSGASAAIADGAWLNGDNIDRAIGSPSLNGCAFLISVHKPVSLRVAPNRFELRSVEETRVAHGFLWLMAAVIDGQQTGSDTLKAEGVEIPRVVYEPQVALTEDATAPAYGIAALLFSAKARPNAKGELDFEELSADRGVESDTTQRLTDNIILAAIRVDEHGSLFCTEQSISEAYNQMRANGSLSAEASVVAPAVVKKRLEPLLTKVYFRPQRNFEAKIIFEYITPGWREQRHLGSSAMRIAFGDHLEPYAAYLKQAQYDLFDK